MPGQPPIKTRRVWQKNTRVLQVKKHPYVTFQTVLGNPEVGRHAPENELAMLMRSFTNDKPSDPLGPSTPLPSVLPPPPPEMDASDTTEVPPPPPLVKDNTEKIASDPADKSTQEEIEDDFGNKTIFEEIAR